MRAKHKGRAFDHRVVRKIFGPTKDEVTGDWEKTAMITNLMILYFSPNIIWLI